MTVPVFGIWQDAVIFIWHAKVLIVYAMHGDSRYTWTNIITKNNRLYWSVISRCHKNRSQLWLIVIAIQCIFFFFLANWSRKNSYRQPFAKWWWKAMYYSVCSLDCPYISDDTQIYVHVLCMELSRLIASRHIGFCFNFSIVWVLCWIVSFFFLRGWGCDILRFLTPKKTSPNVHEGRSYMAPEPFISTYF